LTKRRKQPPIVQINDGEWVTISWDKQREMCCDCGLVHETDYRVTEGGKLQFRAFRKDTEK
jgi:hypothetical protein